VEHDDVKHPGCDDRCCTGATAFVSIDQHS
jgi:hypothetical protein